VAPAEDPHPGGVHRVERRHRPVAGGHHVVHLEPAVVDRLAVLAPVAGGAPVLGGHDDVALRHQLAHDVGVVGVEVGVDAAVGQEEERQPLPRLPPLRDEDVRSTSGTGAGRSRCRRSPPASARARSGCRPCRSRPRRPPGRTTGRRRSASAAARGRTTGTRPGAAAPRPGGRGRAGRPPGPRVERRRAEDQGEGDGRLTGGRRRIVRGAWRLSFQRGPAPGRRCRSAKSRYCSQS
jgi:hypothetical protein